MREYGIEVYEEKWVIDRIYEVSDSIRHRITDQTLFEERCIKRVGGYLKGDEKRVNNRRYIERLIKEVASSVIERNRNEIAELFSALTQNGNEEDELEFDPIDVLADVESEAVTKETIALLAEGDRKKETVLQSWADGNGNATSISRTLASMFGGNEKSQRVYVHRFRTECRKRLATA